MKRKSIQSMVVAVLLVGAISLGGCATPQNPYTYQGAGLGAAVGAAIGAGTNGKNPWKGAAIGGLLGGALGGVAGEMYGRSNPYCPPNCPPPQGYYQSGPQPRYGYQPYSGYTQTPYNASQGTASPYYDYAY